MLTKLALLKDAKIPGWMTNSRGCLRCLLRDARVPYSLVAPDKLSRDNSLNYSEVDSNPPRGF